MDFGTVGTLLGKRMYVFAIISHKTREIVRFALTENPTREFSPAAADALQRDHGEQSPSDP
jgi:hypothetical protein